MRKDTSTLESEFIQGGSHDDSNTNAHSNINSVENIAIGDCDSSSIPKQGSNMTELGTSEQRDEKSLLGNDHKMMSVHDEDSLPFLVSVGSSDSSETAASVSPTTATAVAAASVKPKSPKSVSFGHCSIRSYNQILGDHPLCAVGCPIALGWKVVREEAFSVDDHEAIREPLRKKKGSKSPLQSRRKHLSHNGHEVDSMSMEPCFKYINSQLKLSAQERRERLRDCSDVQIRKEWSRMQNQARRGLVKEGMRQFRMIGKEYAGY